MRSLSGLKFAKNVMTTIINESKDQSLKNFQNSSLMQSSWIWTSFFFGFGLENFFRFYFFSFYAFSGCDYSFV